MATQLALILPTLEATRELGGAARPADIYDRVAAKVTLSQQDRARRVPNGASTVNAFERSVRWAQQRAKLLGLLERVDDTWRLTDKGRQALTVAPAGKVLVAFSTDRGLALWGDTIEAARLLDDGLIQCIITSPPYPILRRKAYGGITDVQSYIDWLLRVAEAWLPKLAGDGSFVINIGDAWAPGQPVQTTYQERLLIALEDRLGLHLAERFAWQNPAKLPAPAQWVNIERCRVKPSLEQVYWLSPSPRPKADNRRVLVPYSDAMQKRLAEGGERGADRPSGYQHKQGAFGTDNGGAIPGNLITASNTDSCSTYLRRCREAGLPVHPARFPAALPEFFTKLCTDPGDTVADIFGGSGITAKVAEDLDRRWLIVEQVREYLEGARLRFEAA